MRKIFNNILIATVGCSLLLSSCNFLDVDHYFEATFKEDSIFHSRRNAENYLWNVPGRFPDPGKIWGNSWFPGQLASDEITVKWRTNEFWGTKFTVGDLNEETLYNWDLWYSMYRVIRRCNTMLANIDKVVDMTSSEKDEYRGYVHFMRGYAYYHLFMNWGPCLIVGDDVLSTDEDAEYYNKERSTFDETIDYICGEFAKSLKSLKKPNELSLSLFERPSKGAALGLIARLRLYQASPTFNGGDSARRVFGTWIRKSDGKHYVNQEYDADRWAIAAAAAKQVIDLEYYNLHTVEKDKQNPYPIHPSVPDADFPNGARDIDPYSSFSDMFTGETPAKVNKEFVWAVETSANVVGYARHSFPVKFGGWGGMSVPQRVVDAFLMHDGKTISESTEYVGDPTQLTNTAKSYGSYQLKTGVPKMFFDRSARFYASIGFPGRFWEMNTASADAGYVNRQFWYSNEDTDAGKAGAGNNPNDYSVTGYVPVKYIHRDDSFSRIDGSAVTAKPFAIIRYAEVLLQYVEALNNVETTSTVKTYDENGELKEVTVSRDVAEMKKSFNPIRYRVGLPGPTEEEYNSKEKFEKVIRNERQVELFNEGYRYFDTRRWGTYLDEDANSDNWRGFAVDKDRTDANGNGGFFSIVQINEQNIRDRIAKPKMIFLPIHKNELIKVPNMDQNPGWDDSRK